MEGGPAALAAALAGGVDEHNAQRERVTESLIRCPAHEDAGERPGSGH
jgi:hypothetical protein